MIIDAHVHAIGTGDWPHRYFDAIAYQWGHKPRPSKDPAVVRDKIEPGLVDALADQMVSDLDAAGVDIAIQTPIDWGPDFDEPEGRTSAELLQENAAAMATRHAGRLLSFAGIDPRRKNAVEILAHGVEQLGLLGAKLYPPMGWYPYDRCAFPVYDYCQSKEIPVLFHTGISGLPMTLPRFSDPVFIADVQFAFPRLNIWMGHAGGRDLWQHALEIAARSANTHLEFSTWIWHDTTEEQKEDLIRKLDRTRHHLGAHRILFGSDHVSGNRVRGREFLPKVVDWYRELPERADALGVKFTEAEMELIMGRNVADQLKLHAPTADQDKN